MPTYLGNTAISGIYLGSTPIQAVYLGTTSLFSAAPTITSVSPLSASSADTITVKGSGFNSGSLAVSVGTTVNNNTMIAVQNLVIVDDNTITFRVAGGTPRGPQDIKITNSIDSITQSNALTVLRPTISNFYPNAGTAGNDFSINGYDFDLTPTMSVLFSQTGVTPVYATNVTVVSPTQIVCKVPTLASGDWRVSVSAANGSGSTSQFTFYYAGKPDFSSIYPPSGTTGDVLLVSGTNFVQGSTTVAIGGINATLPGAATDAGIVMTNSVYATVPSGLTKNQTYAVTVTTPYGTVTANNVFTFTVPSPAYSSISPTSGKAGSTLTINGSGFISGTSVTIGGVSATNVNVTSLTSLTCTVPTLSTFGTKDIVITTAGGTVTASGVYTFLGDTPTISSVSPPQGTGGNTVTLTGTNFNVGTTTVTINGATVTPTVTATSISFTCPFSGTAGFSSDATVSIVVTTSGGGSASTTWKYYTNRAASLTTYSTAGSGTYTIPDWCNKVDVVCMGGGGAGGGSSIGAWGGGGNAGSYSRTTLTRGSSIPWTTTTLSYTVGSGGASTGMGAGGSGNASSAAGVVTAAGGTGGGAANNGPVGTTTAQITYNSANYPAAYGGGGGDSSQPNANPGSGGGGGNSAFGPYVGIAGRAGAVYFRAYL